jgi:aspartate aminotransferase-like enzyme
MRCSRLPWGEPILPEAVAARLAGGEFDAVTIVHNETSTGVTSPIQEIASRHSRAPRAATRS